LCNSPANGDNSGGSIGAGLFVGTGGAFNSGGPGSVVSIKSAIPTSTVLIVLFS